MKWKKMATKLFYFILLLEKYLMSATQKHLTRKTHKRGDCVYSICQWKNVKCCKIPRKKEEQTFVLL